MILPVAHVGHYLWVLYLLPIVFVVIGIVRSTMIQRGKENGEESD